MKITDILFGIFLLLAIIFFFWYLLGDSPTLEQTLLILITGMGIKFYGEFKEFKGDYNSFKKNVGESFTRLKEDLKKN